MPMPGIIKRTCRQIASTVPWANIPLTKSRKLDTSGWQNYKPEAGVVNFYQYRDSLTAHVDQSEVDSVRPLISISLGESCIFLAGGTTRNQKPIPFLLNSGDVIIMAGDARRVFHGVPRIIEASCRAPFDWSQHANGRSVQDFLKGTRLNINVRQVFSEDTQNLQTGDGQSR
jgi:alkylated DNA repair protein alkB family protein 1